MKNIDFGLSENVTIKTILKYNYVMHNIDKQDIINQNFKSTLNIIKKFEQAGKQGKDKLLLLFYGYDNVREEIYEIPEIRNYVKKLIKKIPHLFYFLSNFQQNKGLITACIS